MIKSGIYLKIGDIIYFIEILDNKAVVLRSNEWWTDIFWDDGSSGRIEVRNLGEFDTTGENIEYKVKELLALINFI